MRLFVILRHLVPLALSFLRDQRRWIVAGSRLHRTPAFHQARADRLLRSIAALGPSFVKLGQVFAGRTDLLGEPYAERLKALTDRVPPVPTATIVAAIEHELGRPLADVFDDFGAVPIASGSLGQVHGARYRGHAVAVKVLRPGVESMIARDLAVARAIVRRLVGWAPNVHTRAIEAVLTEFSIRIRDELDFAREAANLTAVRANFGRNPRIRIPAPFPEISTGRLLVLEFVAGTRIDELDPGRRYGRLNAAEVVDRLIELYLRMMFVHGFFHADPHPGNLLVADDGALVLLDFGVVIRVPPDRREHLIRTSFASIRNDAAGVVEGFYALGIVEPGIDRAVIERLAHVLLDLAARRTTAAERIDFLTRQVLDELHDWPIRLPSDLVYFARTAALIEGIGVRYDPRFNPIMRAGPVLFRMRAELAPVLGTLGPLDGGLGDWPTAIGYLVGRATAAVSRAGEAIARLLTEGFGRPQQGPRGQGT